MFSHKKVIFKEIICTFKSPELGRKIMKILIMGIVRIIIIYMMYMYFSCICYFSLSNFLVLKLTNIYIIYSSHMIVSIFISLLLDKLKK